MLIKRINQERSGLILLNNWTSFYSWRLPPAGKVLITLLEVALEMTKVRLLFIIERLRLTLNSQGPDQGLTV